MKKYTLTAEQAETLKQYPVLNAVITEYIMLDGGSVMPGHLPTYIFWLRRHLNNVDIDEFLGWDETWQDDFYSWGSNSRWANTFTAWVNSHFSDMVDNAIYLAKEYGDAIPDID